MLRKTILVLGLALSAILPASADLAIDNFKAYRGSGEIRFQMTLHNLSDVQQQGPILIRLLSHPNASAGWTEINNWNVEVIEAGAGWSETLESSDEFANAKASGYEAKLVVEAPGMVTAEKKTGVIGK